ADVDKRQRITAFNDFGGRTPSEKPPVKIPSELAKERGEPWPPEDSSSEQAQPATNGVVPGESEQSGSDQSAGAGVSPGTSRGSGPDLQDNGQSGQPAGAGQHGQQPGPASAVPPNYGAPPGWAPATAPGANYPAAGG